MIVDCDENMVDNGIETLQKAVSTKAATCNQYGSPSRVKFDSGKFTQSLSL